jgi:hypothetical protein
MVKVLGGILGAIVLISISLFASYVGAYNNANAYEKQIIAVYDNNKNILTQYTNRVQEVAQVPALQRDDLMAVVTAALQGRYGNNGSQATFQWIQEQNPQINSSVYINLQEVITAGRISFQDNQTKLLDLKRAYETELGSFWSGMWMKFAGYPMINLKDYDIVTSTSTNQIFDSGNDTPIKLR